MNVNFMNVCTQIISKNLNLKPRWSWRSRMSYNVDNLLCTEKQNWDKARRLWNQNKRASRTYSSRSQFKTCYFVYCHSADILPCLFKFFFAFFLLIITKLQHKENKEKKVQVFLPLEKKREKKNETQTKKNSNTLFLWTFQSLKI